MSVARYFDRFPAGKYAKHIALIAICVFTLSTINTVGASDTTLVKQGSRLNRKLDAVRALVIGRQSSLFDRILGLPEGVASIDPVTVSLPDLFTLEGADITIPVTVGDTTGKGIRSFQFDLLYDPDVIIPQAEPIDTVGTISAGMGVSINDSVPGVLRVVFFTSTHRTGAGTLFKFKFTAVGADEEETQLEWQDFMFNEGDPASVMTNGSVLVVTNPTITVTQTANGTIAPGTTVVPYGTNQAFTITPVANHHIVYVLVDGLSVGAVSNYTFTNVTADRALTATFAIDTYAITATSGSNGTVTPTGVTNVPHGGSQAYTITPGPNYLIDDVLVDGGSVGAVTNHTFSNVTAAHTISATFKIKRFALTVIKSGNGVGTVTSLPTGINCGSDCDEIYDIGTPVTLTAAPTPGTTFTGWNGGGCSGTGTCIVTMDAAKEVTAAFALQTNSLTVTKPGNGSGLVTSDPAGIDCGTDCTETYTFGTVVTLTATPTVGSNFTGWSGGGCSGTGTCQVTIDGAKGVAATFVLQTYSLTVIKAGNGTGTVTSDPTGIDCGVDCVETYNYGTSVTLTATPNVSSNFTGWSGGGCSGTGTCIVPVTAAASVTATFTLKIFTLDVVAAGNGGGTVTSSPTGIDCGVDCNETYNHGTVVTLTATPNASSNFTGWSGGSCSGTGTCVVTVTSLTTVTATFTLKTFTLGVVKAGNGTGTVSSAPIGIDCGIDCTEVYNIGTVVTLTAAPATGSNFTGWSGGGCAGTGTCVVTMNASTSVTATFALQTFALTVIKSGNGVGTVSSSPTGINCGSDCDEIYNIGTIVTLTAVPATGTTFTGWSGGVCSGTGACIVTMDAAKEVTANFVLQTFPLNVTKPGTGSGLVTSVPPGIDCGTDCSETYNYGTVVTLTATPTAGSNFTGWSGGGCSGTGTCQVTMDAAKGVAATFVLQTFSLNVIKAGNGTGTVTSDPTGIDCGVDCVETYNYGTSVTLTATPNVSSNFTGWSGGCSGTGTCVVPITAAASVTATFTLKTFTLDVAKAGNGGGTVVSSPPGIDCGVDCNETYNYGTVVTLIATPNASSNFTGWSGGGCSGTGTCVVTVTASTTVTATFTLKTFTLNVAKAGNGTGTVSSAPIGIDCGVDCTEVYNSGTVVTLTAAPATGSTFSGWSGGCAGTGTCVVTINASTTITATFTLQTFALNVAKAGNGSGTVTSAPGIDCGADCTETYNYGTVVTLTASPTATSDFAGWSGGGCSGTGSCVVTISAATTVTATFTLKQYSFTLQRIGTGTGNVLSSPPGIDCGSDCFELYNHGTVVTLTATPNSNSNFTGWSGGGCSGTGTCVVTVTAATTVMANFMIKTFALNVTLAGGGSGVVTSSPPGIDCGADCVETFNFGTVVTLTATPNSNSNFTGWSGAGCSGTGTCQVAMNAAAAVTATFALKTFTLTAVKAGTGEGTVTSSPLGVDCGADCSETYVIGTSVSLTAVAVSGSTFDGWSGGGCTGTGTCVVTINAATSVTATFTRIVRTLEVTKTGNGFGTISSSPAGINCGGNCTASFPIGSVVTLTASPNVGTNFMGWSGGGCSGTGTCVVTLNATATVTANFVLQTYPLSVVKGGTGAGLGTVSSAPVGISCGADCDENYNFGNVIALNASVPEGTTFNGWSGAGCSGTGTCVVTMSGAVIVTASFTTQTFGLTVTKSSNGSGVVTSDVPGVNCGTDCVESYNFGTVVTLTATPNAGTDFVGWTGGLCSGTGTCVVTMSQARSVNAVFTLQIYTMSVEKTGNGVGTVTSLPGGINCGADCSEPYNYGTVVTLTATPNASSNFAGWSGAGCTGTGTCVVTITQAADVIATFNLKTFTLDVGKTSNGTGTITGSPSGINCGGDCTEVYNIGTVVTLTATPGLGSSFAGWAGGCTGTGLCVVTMNANTFVTAAFNTFPTVQFNSAIYKGNESRTALLTITRTGDLSIASSVTLSTSPGTASGSTACTSFGADYVDISQPVNFAPLETVQSVTVVLCPDKDIDPFETIGVLLSAPVNANLGSQNPASIAINDTANQYLGGQDGILLFSNTNAEPYPSVINAVDAPTGTARVRVTLYDAWHSLPNNLRALLVSPAGVRYVLMAAAGGNTPVPANAPVTITFADFQAQILPLTGPLLTGSYKPTTCFIPIPNFVSSAPSGPYLEPGCDLSAGPILGSSFSGPNQDGGWQLYLMDAGTGVPFTLAGSVTGGWGLELVPTNPPLVEVTGRVLTPGLLGLRNAVVSLTNSEGQRQTVSTSSLGFFTFDNVEAGRTYIITISSRRYRFESRVLQFANSVQDLEFVGLE